MSTATEERVYVNQVLSPIMNVKALEEGQVAIYRLQGSGKLHPKTKRPINPSGLTLKGKTVVLDKVTRSPVTLMNVTAYNPVELPDGTLHMKPVIGRVVWGKTALLYVRPEEPQLYAYLERHNANASNKFRDTTRRALFYRVNKEGERQEKFDQDELELEARLLVRNAAVSEIKVLAEGFDKDPKRDIGELRHILNQIAKRTPLLLIRKSSNKALKRKIFIGEAEDHFLILYKEEDKMWYWNKPDMEDPEICRVEVGEIAKDKLAEVLKSPAGRKHERMLHSELEKLGFVKEEFS